MGSATKQTTIRDSSWYVKLTMTFDEKESDG